MKAKRFLVALWFTFINVDGVFSSENVTDDTCMEQLPLEEKELNRQTVEEETKQCADTNEKCRSWAKNGGCVNKPHFMFEACKKSCSVCDEDVPVDKKPCLDGHRKCEYWESKNECVNNAVFMLSRCPRVCKACASSITHTIDFGVRQKEDDEAIPYAKAVVRQSKQYMRKILADSAYAPVREVCRNGNEMCSIWAAQGECKHAAMQVLCGPACQSCDALHIKRRCTSDPNAVGAIKNADDMTDMFVRIADSEEFAKYKPSVIYSPYSQAIHRLSRSGPWYMSFDNFLSDEEIDKIIEHGKRKGYGKSEEVTIKPQVDGSYAFYASTYRTSKNSWCDAICEEDPVIQGVMERVANMTGLPQENAEPFQLLQYEKDQQLGIHHDYIEYQKFRPCGVRILTFFFYLNDDFEGGEINYVRMHNLTIVPKRGKALLWTNVLSQTPNEEDELLDHRELPVLSGVKYAANIWIHQHNFRTAYDKKCS